MTKQTPEEIRKANEQISRPGGERPSGRRGKIVAGQRGVFAANPVGDEGSEPSETEQAVERASHNDERG